VRPGRAADHSPPYNGRVELYLYSPSGPHRACNGITLHTVLYDPRYDSDYDIMQELMGLKVSTVVIKNRTTC